MDCPEPFKNDNNGSSSASDLSNNNNSPDSPQEESPYCRYVSSLSPINIKASHGTRCFLGLSSPPPVFKSPRISHRQKQFMRRPQGNQSLGEVRSQSENGGNMKDDLSDKSEESLPLSEDSNKVHQQMPAYGEESKRMEGEQSHIEKRYSHNPLLPQATLNYHDVGRRRIQFEERASSALESNKSREKLNATSIKMKRVELDESVTSSLYPQQGCGDLPLPGSKQSGIGLLLNTIANAMPTNEAATTGVRLPDSSPTMKPASSKGLQRRENIKTTINYWSKFTPKSSVDTRSHRMLNSDEFNRSYSPCKKKKKTSVAANQDKRCRCKKSLCIQLYCECFNAGLYCTGPCGCQFCLNRPEYEQAVLKCKREIEYRYLSNPKSRNEEGCSCITCACLKNYCPCYQAKVGCSSGCQCGGCKNSYGKKEDLEVQHTSNDQEMVASDTDSDLELLSPIRPSLQCSDQGKDAAKPPESLGWCSSPLALSTPVCETQSPGSDCTLFNMIVNEIIKLPTPLKVNSTSQKRVSPPQSGLVIGSSSSGGLREEGRRIISQSAPPFPPLSPSVDSKSSNNEDQGNSQSKGPHSPSR